MTKDSQKFRTQGEQSRIAIENIRDQLQKTVAAYDAVLAAKEKKLQSTNKKLTQEIGKSQKMVQDGRKQIEAFQKTADGFFVMWEEQVGTVSSESIRQASEKRLEAAKTGYQNMMENLAAAREAYDPFIVSLSEQATLLTQDSSPDTVAMLRDDVAPDLHSKAETLFASIERILSKEAAHEAEVNEILDEEDSEVGAEMEAETGEETEEG
jgi:hypothetical protein